jgi:hypothetical protein
MPVPPNVREDAVVLAVIEKFGNSHRFPPAPGGLSNRVDGKANHAVEMRVRKGVDDDAIDRAEDHGDGTDAQRQREHGHQRKFSIFIQAAKSEPQIALNFAEEILHGRTLPWPAQLREDFCLAAGVRTSLCPLLCWRPQSHW